MSDVAVTPEPVNDLVRIFAEDLLKLTNPDIAVVVAYFRVAREKYLAGEKNAGAPKKMKEKAGPKVKSIMDDIDTSALDL